MQIGDDLEDVERPWLTLSLIAVCCLVYGGELYSGEIASRFAEIPAILTGAKPDFAPENIGLATILTSAFLHADPAHLLGNIWFLWIFGRRIEDSFGRTMMICFILICQIAASAAETFTHPTATGYGLGASGFISGLMGAYLALFPTAKIRDFDFANYWLAGRFTIAWPAWVWLGFWIVFQLIAARTDRHDGVAYAAHIGGFAVGFVISRILHAFGLAATYAPASVGPARGALSATDAAEAADEGRRTLLFGRIILCGCVMLAAAAYLAALALARAHH